MFLSEAQAARLAALYDEHLLYYNFLAKAAVDQGHLYYAIVPKTHALVHLSAFALYMNPRFLWAYEMETFMGLMTTSAKACVAGTPMCLVGDKCMQNFLLNLEIRLFGVHSW